MVRFDDGLTLSENLYRFGYTHRAPLAKAGTNAREIIDESGDVVFTGDYWEVVAWLRAKEGE